MMNASRARLSSCQREHIADAALLPERRHDGESHEADDRNEMADQTDVGQHHEVRPGG